MSNNSNLNTGLLLIITVILIGVILRYTSQVFVPFAISILCLYTFRPVLYLLQRKLHFPRILAIVMVILLFIAISVLAGYALYTSLRSLASQYPLYEGRLSDMIARVAERYNLTEVNTTQFFSTLDVQTGLRGMILSLSGGSISFLSGLVLVVLFLLFLLLEQDSLIENATAALNREQGASMRKIVRDVNRKVGKYISAKLWLSASTAGIVYIGLLFIGLDFPFVWGVLVFLLNFIPSIGSIIVTLLAVLFAIVQFVPNWGPVIATAVLIVCTQVTFGNILEPRVIGKSLNISAVVIMLSLLTWAVIWGVAGLFLAVPMTVLFISILDAIPLTKPISAMMLGRKR